MNQTNSYLPRNRGVWRTLLTGTVCLVLPIGAIAQSTTGSGEQLVVEVEPVLVTGSRIGRIDREGPTPVTVITREQIDKLGYTTVKDVLGNLTYNSGGTFDAGRSFNLGKGTQSVNLRGFGAGRTLVLLDGRRLPVFPQGRGTSGSDSFVDLSTIPASLVQRVEILLDGASAVYGSDAIGGVINIITRRDVEGTEAIARVSGTEDGGGSAQRYQLMHGLASGDTSVQFVGEYIGQSVLRHTDRDYAASDFGNGGVGSLGSTFIGDDGQVIPDANCGTPQDAIGGLGVLANGMCLFDRNQFRQFIPDGDRGSLYLRAERRLAEIDSFIHLGYVRNRQRIMQEQGVFTGGDSSAFTRDRIIPDSEFIAGKRPGYVPIGASNNPTTGSDAESGGFFFRRLTEFGLRGTDLTTESFNGLVGFSGLFGEYSWSLGLARNEVRFEGVSPTALSSILDNEVTNNGLDLFSPIPDAVVIRASHERVNEGVSRNGTVDGTLSGPVGISLSGGPIKFAVHADYVDEKYADRFDRITQAGDTLEPGFGGGGDRKYTGTGIEFSLPILSSLEVGIAGRYDQYDDASDVGGAFSPSVRAGFHPWSFVLLRASYGETFRAPDLQRLFGSQTATFSTVVDTPRCIAAGGTPGNPVDPANANDPCRVILNVPTVTGSNTELEEEEGENFNVGIVVEPIENLDMRIDYYEIEVDDLVSSLSAQQVLDNCASTGAFCSQIRRNPETGLIGMPTTGGDNQALVSAVALNLARQEVHGYDFGVAYQLAPTRFGIFDGDFSWSHLTSLRVRSLPDRPDVQQIGFGQTVRVPRDRFALTLDWSLAQFGATLRVDRIGKYPGGFGLTTPARASQFVDPYTTVNLQGRVDLGKLGRLRLGVDNLLDEDFPLDPTFLPGSPNTQNQFIIGPTTFFASPLGRQGYVQYEFRF